MKIPKRIQPLVDDGLVDKVLRQLMSGKEATVFVVQCGDEIRCAKVYKEASKRSFKQAVLYNEGRKVRNGRRARAMEKGSKFGRQQQEEVWQNAEVDALYKLADAGVRVPQPFGCFEGVLLMELITDEEGFAAPRLNDVSMSEEQAIEDHRDIMQHIVRMLSVGIVHGDLSEFNVLVDEWGPVIIDLPQAVDAAANNNAKSMLLRDVNNMTTYFSQFAPELSKTQYGKEIWSLYEAGELSGDSQLSGKFVEQKTTTDVNNIIDEIEAARNEHEENQQRIATYEVS
ncbi:serine protein kinase RIO [Psychromonas sp. psych-6C06]|uniref:PA4780 family RIO1-like protein kinase n=1 Tax=Psychromonas sp. psych-6C06 TaxID=2058089 RepID=UPI000C33D7C3|nr:PA4780 family RIO1-like protein kinase [Psychromonas sp. psych-6C06]PKF63731.1 serine protein kinase RIO [Psychromonas sp. psych-6C06]